MTLGTSGTKPIRDTLRLYATVCLLLFSAQVLKSQQSETTQKFIERVEVEGYRRVQLSTIRAHILSRPGGSYDADAVQRDAQALRDTGYFSEVQLKVDDSPDRPNGKIVMFVVVEKPIIRRIRYEGIESITEADIINALKSNKVPLSVESPFDEFLLARSVGVLKGLLSEHGHPSANVTTTYERIASSNAVSIVFSIDEGPKAR
jgi:outer membrane protein insertion porin family